MSRRLLLLLSLLVCATTLTLPAWGAPNTGLRRFALIAATNDGGADRVRLRFADSDARAMADVLKYIGGVQSQDLTLLTGARKVTLKRAFDQVRASLAALPRGRQRHELIVYYSGHSDEQGLLLGGELVSYRELRSWVDAAGADVRIVILDSCASGALIRLRGGTRRPSFLSDVSVDARGHAFLTASSASEAAQESDRLRAGFFSHYLLSALRGAADTNRDGLVTLAEAYQFAYHGTLQRTAQTAHSQHPAYDFQLAGQGDLVLTDLRSSSASLILDDPVSGRIHVRNRSGRLLVELQKAAGYAVQLGLGPGEYALSLLQGGRTYRTTVTLSTGKSAHVGQTAFASVLAEPAQVRGDEADLQAEPTLTETLIGEQSLVGQTTEVGGYAGLNFRYTQLGGSDGFLAGLEVAMLLNRRIAIGFTAAGGISNDDAEGMHYTLGFAAAVFRYHFIFDSPFSFSLGALGGAGGVNREHEDPESGMQESDGDPDGDAIFLFQPELGGHLSVTRFLRFGVDVGYRVVAGAERYRVSDVRGVTAGFNVQLGWF